MGSKETVVVGPCRCGGYGVCYDEETEKKIGRCHDNLERSKKKKL